MRPKSIAILMLALGCGLVAMIGITQVMAKRNKGPAASTGQTQPIFVAMTDVGMGDLLNSRDLKLEQWPKDKIPPGAVLRLEDVEGRRTRTKLYAGEPILDNKLMGKGANEQGAAATIPKGYRVVPVKVDLVSGGSSMILPGDRVDVMVHLFKDKNRGIGETMTRTILQDIKVFAVNDVVGMENDADPGKSIPAKTISLLVTPEQAAKVTLASQLGKIQLVMRGPGDDKQVPDAQATPAELFGAVEKSDRQKETASQKSEPDQKNKGFVDFLDSMKRKLADKAPPQSNTPAVWTMRILKPDGVTEVKFEEAEGGPDSTSTQWINTPGPVSAAQTGWHGRPARKSTDGGKAQQSPAGAGEKPVPPAGETPMPSPPAEPQGPKLGPGDK